MKESGILIHDSADRVPAQPPGRHPLAPISGADFRETPRWKLPPQAWLVITVCVLLPVLWVLWRLDSAFRDWFERNPGISDTGLALLLVAVGCGVLFVLGRGFFWALSGVQGLIVRTRHGAPASAWRAAMVDPVAADMPHVFLEAYRSQFAEHPLLSTKSISGPAVAKSAEQQAPVLPNAGPQLVPSSEWLGWLNEAPHLLIAGATNTGKTTFARIALRQALEAGASGFIIDPKGKDWFGLPSAGAGRDFTAMLNALDGVRAELDTRYQAYGQGQRSFQPLVIVVDEVPDLMQACKPLQGQRSGDPRWSLFARSLGSLAREVAIRVILISQSPAVEDLGINSGMRANYARIALREQIPLLINEDVSQERRQALRQLYQGQRFPAACIRHGEVHLLNTADVVSLAARHFQGSGWQPTAKLVDTKPQSTQARIKWYRRHGYGRAQARADGLRFNNDDWAEAGKTQTQQTEGA